MPSSILLCRRSPAVSTKMNVPAVILHRRVDRVARGAGDLGHDQAALTEQSVHERRLADVRAPDHRNAHDVFGLGDGFGQTLDDLVEEVTGAFAVHGRHGKDFFDAHRVELVEVAVRGSSTLFATSSHGFPELRSSSATCASAGCSPTFASTTNSNRSASPIASSTWRRISTSIGVCGSSETPPVSTS